MGNGSQYGGMLVSWDARGAHPIPSSWARGHFGRRALSPDPVPTEMTSPLVSGNPFGSMWRMPEMLVRPA